MEERIIDDEYGRGIRLKKTKDGYVDVTDELAENGEETLEAEQTDDEVAFAFPTFDTDEDDEDLVGLSPEEAAELIKRKEEEAAARKAEYDSICAAGEKLLSEGSFKAAELQFEKALSLDEEAVAASVGYWRAKTSDFADPDVLVGEYADASIESLEYDLGLGAVEIIKREYKGAFEKRYAELTAEEEPLAQAIEEKQVRRREIISARLKKSTVAFLAVTLPMLVFLALGITFLVKNSQTLSDQYLVPMIIFLALLGVTFIAFIFVTNKWINDFRMRRANERLSETEEGVRLLTIRDYKAIYECLLDIA